jgi:hypothetical protein
LETVWQVIDPPLTTSEFHIEVQLIQRLHFVDCSGPLEVPDRRYPEDVSSLINFLESVDSSFVAIDKLPPSVPMHPFRIVEGEDEGDRQHACLLPLGNL